MISEHPNQLPLNWEMFFQPLPIFFFICSLILAGIFWFFWRNNEKVDFIWGPTELGATDKSLKQFYGWIPFILGIHVAIPLIVNGVQGRLFISHHPLEGILSNWVGLFEIFIALSLFYGGLTRLAALFMGTLWFIGIDLIGFQASLESIQYLGYACFFYLAGRGPYAIDRILFPDLEPKMSYADAALLLLRAGIGFNFIVFGFTQKLANIPYALSLVGNHPFLKLIAFPDEMFVLLVGAIEVLGGIMILFGIFPRFVTIIALICINASLTVTQWNEVIDHLPLYAALAILLVWEPNNPKQKLLWVDGLRKSINENSKETFG